MDDDSKSGGIRIVDRRRFDSEGKERPEDSSAETTSTAQKDTKPSAPQKTMNEPKKASPTPAASSENQDEDEGDISFSSLLMSLATQALMQLGEMNPPEGTPIPVDPEGAKQTIEILGMLQRKTKGNLSSEEATLLEEVLHNLRVGYVRVTQALMQQNLQRKGN